MYNSNTMNLIQMLIMPIFAAIGITTNSTSMLVASDAMTPALSVITQGLFSKRHLKTIFFLLLPVITGFIYSKALSTRILHHYKPNFKKPKIPDDYYLNIVIGCITGYLVSRYPMNATLIISLAVASGLTSNLTELGMRFGYGKSERTPLTPLVKLSGYFIGFLFSVTVLPGLIAFSKDFFMKVINV